ncbi:hypothetical protein FJV41_23895 [Myxococcus llanfairpwllgwyngyllgogerychwyrndrobwllllantysiliogogogochensis]|uniref:Outer membrane protein beta-barrel domain-containing protein n=1 Tax=Myxococcus llanfairpwllgwyngyllgogerychwyrndrobwllllantysiliogogogochensis TaxID=2590453 RepID=A0A540WWQ5_9BACT|nr:hypothetical protein [Myxococcus llanfairpwllgwyngyllgogerychwyrndrobwllllantysiliogogogochensis]TQF13435.1 hypothetical protein FJV41_23895 [Myxococcus llanfairpwllgwyngyllgogerychwyrndrobwllllantysiliogogogochensis]
MRFLRPLLMLVGLAPVTSSADSREIYVLLSGGPSLLRLEDPLEGAASASAAGGGIGVTAYYGLTDELHLGASVGIQGASNVTYAGTRVTLPSGSRPLGDLQQDLLGLSFGLVAHYRYDTGAAWAPFAQLELGGQYRRHHHLVHLVSNTELGAAFPDVSKVSPAAGLQLGLEYRFRNWLTTSVGLGVTTNPADLGQVEFRVPITVGIIFG